MWVPTKPSLGPFQLFFELLSVHQIHLVSKHLAGAKHCYIGRQSQDSRQDQPISKQMSSTAHELHILFSTRHWRGKGIKIPILESSSCQLIKIFTMLWFLAERFSVKHGYPQPICHRKILISKTKKRAFANQRKALNSIWCFCPTQRKAISRWAQQRMNRDTAFDQSRPRVILWRTIIYFWLSIYLRRESC